MMSHSKVLAAAVAIALGGSAVNAWAATSSMTFNVTATVINHCNIGTAPIAFGNYDPTSAVAVTAQGSVTAKCTKGDVVSVALDQGLNPAGGSTAAVPARQMLIGGNLLPYHIYIAASPSTTEWGTGVVGTNTPPAQTSVSAGATLTFTTYGSLPAGTDVPAAVGYTDTVTATVTF